MTRPPVHYATTADGLEIAYQVLGDGPIDVVIIPGLFSNIDHNAQSPFYGGYLRRIPRFARTIVLDRRGGGISDREVGSGSAEDRMDDIRAVMDAVGCTRAGLLGQCARALVDAARGLRLEIRAGLHTGEIELRGADVSGLAVHIGARMRARRCRRGVGVGYRSRPGRRLGVTIRRPR